MTISSTPSVWASRVGRYLRFATARAASLRPQPASQSSRSGIAIAVAFWLLLFGLAVVA
jgi:hypothetical protein